MVEAEPVKSVPAVAEQVNTSVPITNLFAKKKTIPAPAPEPEATKVQNQEIKDVVMESHEI